MTRRISILFFAIILSLNLAQGQTVETIDLRTFDYSKADSIALNFPKIKYNSYLELVAPLTANLKTDHEKVRVLFRWIADNIEYSYGNRSNDADKVVKTKKAVCIGYSTLLKEMCNSAGIECEVIDGYDKRTINDINKKLNKIEHAWNAVKLYDKWYLLDATWAVGFWDEKKKKVIKEYNDFYFLTRPEAFIHDHFPKDKKWQLLEKPINKSQFVKPHLYRKDYYSTNIKDLQPNNGMIEIDIKDSLELKFFMDSAPEKVIIELGDDQYWYYPKVQSADKYYFIKQKFEKPGTYEMTIFVNGKSIAIYKLIIED